MAEWMCTPYYIHAQSSQQVMGGEYKQLWSSYVKLMFTDCKVHMIIKMAHPMALYTWHIPNTSMLT